MRRQSGTPSEQNVGASRPVGRITRMPVRTGDTTPHSTEQRVKLEKRVNTVVSVPPLPTRSTPSLDRLISGAYSITTLTTPQQRQHLRSLPRPASFIRYQDLCTLTVSESVAHESFILPKSCQHRSFGHLIVPHFLDLPSSISTQKRGTISYIVEASEPNVQTSFNLSRVFIGYRTVRFPIAWISSGPVFSPRLVHRSHPE
jgi:hypothetical protein